MSYTVLARKYRPQTFADLVGQEHVSRTLGNALQSGRVAHAFLFTGARGVGKTTTARLLAKALNCEQGPTATPCNQCDACREIAAGVDIDVLEIDGASNNGVDDVRRLQETLPFRPARDRFKIVIVDEVHMLSVGAFNAFLKTLEEPPPHVKFVFATTEIHKVPITIRSRCQRYDFRLIPHAVVATKVREILSAEHVSADEAAIALVAREAAGSMRDALTVLDQVLAFGDTELYGETVARGLAIASRDNVLSTVEALLGGDAAACLQRVGAVAEQGLDLLHFTRQLLECARDLVVLCVVGEQDAPVALTPDELARAKQIARAHERAELERLFAGLTKLIEDVGQAALPQMTLEMGLVRLASRPPLVAIQDLIARLKGFEELLSGDDGPPTGGGPAGPGGPGSGRSRAGETGSRGAAPARQAPRSSQAGSPSGPVASAQASRAPARLVAVPPPTEANGNAAPVGGLPASPGQGAAALAPSAPSDRESSPPAAAAQHLSASAAAALRISVSGAGATGATGGARGSSWAATRSEAPAQRARPADIDDGALAIPGRSGGNGSAAPQPTPSALHALEQAPASAAPQLTQSRPPEAADAAVASQPAGNALSSSVPAAPVAPVSEVAPVEVEPVEVEPVDDSEWARIVAQIRTAQPALGAVLNHGMPLVVNATTLHLGFPDGSFFGRQAQSASAREALLKAAQQVLGARPNLVIGSPGENKARTLAEIEDASKRSRTAAKREAALSHPAVVDALEIFEESAANVDVQVDLE